MTYAAPLRLALAAALLAAAPAHAGEAVKRPGVWAQAYTGRAPDPAVRFGVLANGLRYAVMRNATPRGQASLRLLIGSGSLDEDEDQQGLAHFLEHMAFKGSAHVPEGEVFRILQRKGLELGPDTNAATGQDQTEYKFNLPESDPDSLDTGLMLLREMAGELTLSQAAMDSERGVILSEERLRDSPAYRGYVAELGFQLKGQRAAARMPIGKVEVIQTAPVARIRRFYDAHYRPENAVVVAVGDFDPARMEAEIRRRFGDWRARAPAPSPPDLGTVAARGADAGVHVAPGVRQALSLTWARPHDPAADTAARERRDTADYLAVAVLNRRLERLAESDAAPFAGAGAHAGDEARSANLTQIDVRPGPGGWRPALDAALTEQRRLVRFGVGQAELDEEIARLRAYLVNAAAGGDTRTTPALADGLTRAAHDDEVFTSPAEDLAAFEAQAKGLTPAAVGAEASRLFSGSGPLAFVCDPGAVPGGAAEVGRALAAADERPLAQAAIAEARAWPYDSFGPPGAVVSRTTTPDLGVTDVRFANGVRLLVKPTAFAKDRVLVQVRAGYGRLETPPGLAHALWAVNAAPVLALGGTRELTYEQIKALTASRVTDVSLGLEDDALQLGGATRPADLDAELQLLAAYATRPAFRPQAFARMKQALAAELPSFTATATGVFEQAQDVQLHGGDPRWQTLPTADAVSASTAADASALIRPPLASGPLDVVVVGDATPDAAVRAVARTFGALPPRPGRQPAATLAPAVAFPAGDAAPDVRLHAGRADQAVAMEAWPTTGFYADVQEQRVLGALAETIKLRLLDTVRIAKGATYSPAASADSSAAFKDFGYIEAHIETPPAKIAGFYAGLDAIVADLKARPIAADELARVQRPRVAQRIKALQTNGYWLAALSGLAGDPRQADAIRGYVSGTEAVTAADIQAAARRYLTKERAYRLIVRAAEAPAGDAAPPHAGP